jgi:hypothetical protein
MIRSDEMAACLFSGGIGGVTAPDSKLARDAVALAYEASSPMLFNHVLRCYLFGELRAQSALQAYDREVVLLSLVLHDLGLTDRARGERRFEIEGADVARAFVTAGGLAEAKAWLVWDNIALHPLDLNQHKEPEARAVEWGICADVLGQGLEHLERNAVAAIVATFPRLDFKRALTALLCGEAQRKPGCHLFHPMTMVAHHCLGGVDIPDARVEMDTAAFND